MSIGTGQLSQFLKEQKHLFLHDVAAHNLDRWTVVTGNEAGDLDTQASALAYSYLSTSLLHQPTIALSRTARPDLALRPENELAFSRCSLSPSDLLCIDDLPTPLPEFGKMALVDHNRLGPEFLVGGKGEGEGRVVAVIDHHIDEHLYTSASPRIVLPPTQAGSCTSLVTSHFRPIWSEHSSSVPAEVAYLLLCTILIDTGGLKADGKAQAVDREAAAFLMPLAGFPSPASLSADAVPKEVEELFTELITKKYDVSRLSTRDLLRRDYKQYSIGQSAKKVALGLATVPLSLGKWAEKDPRIWEGVDAFVAERQLDAVGILTTYRTDNKGKHRRQIALLFRQGVDPKLVEQLYAALEASEELKLEREEDKEVKWGLKEGRGRIWQQGNVQATRKQVAPLVEGACRGYLGE